MSKTAQREADAKAIVETMTEHIDHLMEFGFVEPDKRKAAEQAIVEALANAESRAVEP